MHENDSTDIALSKAMLRQITRQNYVFEFFNHDRLLLKGWAMMKRVTFALSPRSEILVLNLFRQLKVYLARIRHTFRRIKNFKRNQVAFLIIIKDNARLVLITLVHRSVVLKN